MSELSGRLVVSRLAFKFGTIFRDLARAEARSKAISNSLRLTNLAFGSVAVQTPFYWAQYYHDGRGAFRARPGHKLVYFKDPKKDPRLRGGRYPERLSDVRKLTSAQFYRLLRDRSSGMVVRQSVGPAAGDPFFVRAARRMKRRTGDPARTLMSEAVQAAMGDLMDVKITTRFDLR